MANDNQSQFGFQIRRISDTEPATPPETEPSPANTPKPSPQKTETTSTTGGRFPTAAKLLAFVGMLAGTGLTHEVICRRCPDKTWWVEFDLPHEQVTHLMLPNGGQPFGYKDNQWCALTPTGEWSTPTDDEPATGDLIELADLLAETTLHPRQPGRLTTVHVIVLPSLSRWVLRRALALGIQVDIVAAQRNRLRGENPASSVLLLRLQAKQGSVPQSLLYAITALPYTTVAQAPGPTNERLLIDIHYRPPLAENLLGAMIPSDETWLLGAPDIGHWCLKLQGKPVDGFTLLEPPTLAITDVPPITNAQLPSPLPVRLITTSRAPGHVDAVLLDDTELRWLQTFLASHPLSETVFLLPGLDKHLLTAPGGLPAQIPFGLPLTHLNPGGLFLETGLDFYPSLPQTARQQTFGLNDEQVVVLIKDDAYRFDTKNLIPAWTLWIGKPPPIKNGLGAQSKKILAQIAKDLPEKPSGLLSFLKKGSNAKPNNKSTDLLKQAEQAELAGNFIHAAQLMERADEMNAAGRLYEREALQSSS
jgi:hypothetical protein